MVYKASLRKEGRIDETLMHVLRLHLISGQETVKSSKSWLRQFITFFL